MIINFSLCLPTKCYHQSKNEKKKTEKKAKKDRKQIYFMNFEIEIMSFNAIANWTKEYEHVSAYIFRSNNRRRALQLY